MRHRPIQAAPRERVPFTLWGPKRIRQALATATAAAIGLVPGVFVGSPAYAAAADYLTITDAGNWAGGNVVFKLSYTGSAQATFTIGYSDGPAVSGVSAAATGGATLSSTNDYDTDAVTSVTLNAGTTANPTVATVSVPTSALDTDTWVNGALDESFTLTATHSDTSAKSATGTIWEVQTVPSYTLEAPADPVSEEATRNGTTVTQKTARITARLGDVLPHPVNIPVSTAVRNAGSYADAAVAGGEFRDFDALPSTAVITVPAFKYTGSIEVPLWDDAVDEPDVQKFDVKSGASTPGLTGGIQTATVSIADNETPPKVTVENATAVVEGASLQFPVRLSGLAERPVAVEYYTSNGTVRDDSNAASVSGTSGTIDYTEITAGSPATVTVRPFTDEITAPVVTLDESDNLFEGAENVGVNLKSASAGIAELGTPSTASGIITDDDPGPAVTLTAPNTDAPLPEGDTGESEKKIAVTVASGTYPVPIKIDYKFVDGTAKNGSDYRGTAGTITIPANTSTATWKGEIPVTLIGDKVVETTAGPTLENFSIALTSTTGTIATYPGKTLSITESGEGDAKPTFNVGDVSVTEGDTGTTMAKIPITMTGASPTDTTFTSIFSPSTAVDSSGNLAGDNDYDQPTTSTVTIKAGETTGYLSVPINADKVYEQDQQFSVAITTNSGAVDFADTPFVKHTSRITIGNDDAQPTLEFTTGTVNEGASVAVTGKIVGVSEYPYTLGLTAGGGEPNPATVGTDVKAPDAFAAASITVTRGATGPLTVMNGAYEWWFDAQNDTIDEPTESFTITANETTGVVTGFTPAKGTYKIADDPLDLPPAVSIADVVAQEKDGFVEVPVDLAYTGEATNSTQPVTIPFWTSDGTAKAGEDFKYSKGNVEVPAGVLKYSIKVPLINDGRAEGDEYFSVRLGAPGPMGASVINGDATVTIKANAGGTPTTPTDPEGPKPVTPTIAVSGPSKGAGTATITGRTSPNTTVELWGAPLPASTPGSLKYLTSVKSDGSGNFRVTRAITTGHAFAVQANDLNSAIRTVKLTQNPTLAISSPSQGKLKVVVTGNPKAAGQKVTVQRLSGGKWVNLTTGTTTATNFTKTVSIKSKTKVTIRATVSGTAGINAATTAGKSVTIK